MKYVFPLAVLAVAVAIALVGARAVRADTCPTSNPPNELKVVAGTGQTAQLGHQLQTNLHVALANTNGCAVTGLLSGVFIHYVAPSSGASGVFASTGTNAVGMETDSSGDAVAPAFTANDTAGGYGVIAQSDYGTVTLSLWNTDSGLAASLVASEGGGQSAMSGSTYAQPLRAKVVDANGNPVQGASVSFVIGTGASGASAAFAGAGAQVSAVTNSAGLASSPALVANGSSGSFTATASTSGVVTVATFALANKLATTTVQPLAMRELDATVHGRYSQPLEVRVLDANGQPIEGATVTFSISPSDNGAGATFLAGGTQATAFTDTAGRAISPTLVAGKTAGEFTVTASTIGAQPLALTLRNLAAAPYAVSAGAASGTAAVVGMRFDVPLAVTVVDKNGNPVTAVVVVFTAPAKGPSGRFTLRTHQSRVARVVTNGDGVAVAPPFTAGRTAGGFAVTAAVAGTSKRAGFALVDTPR